MAKELIGTSMNDDVNDVEHSNQCKPSYQKPGWLLPSPRTLCTRQNLNFAYIMLLFCEILLSTCALP